MSEKLHIAVADSPVLKKTFNSKCIVQTIIISEKML